MGRLTVNPLTNTSSVVCKGTVDNQPSDSTVYAEIKINAQVYWYQISGVPFSCLEELPALVAHLQSLLKIQRPFNSAIRDDNYDLARKLTFSSLGHSSQSQVIVSSARALYHFLRDAIKNKAFNVKTLVINDKAQFYQKDRNVWFPWFSSGALELLPETFSKIQPIHFPSLTALQLYMTNESANIILGIKDLLNRNCLSQLKTLDLQFGGICRPARHKDGWIHTNDSERPALYKLLDGVINAPTLPAIEHLHLPFWCAKGTELGLAALRRVYPGLKTLTVDMVIPTAISRDVRLYSSSTHISSHTVPNGFGYNTITSVIHNEQHSVEFQIPEPELLAGMPTLLPLLEEMQGVSQLECLEVYDWPVKQNFVPEYNNLATAITNGWLPKLNSIAIRFNIVSRHDYLLETTIDRQTAADSTSLLKAVIKAQVPLKNLHLIMPEKNGYQGWLDEMKNGSFPELEQFHYRLPDRWFGEQDPGYHTRVETALDTLYTAIQKGQLSKLRVFTVEGIHSHAVQMKRNIEAPPLPEDIWAKVNDIEEALLKPSPSLFEWERELTIETTSVIFHTPESNQAV
jgi:hypothetical protein